MEMVLIKYRDLNLLVDPDSDMQDLLANVDEIQEFQRVRNRNLEGMLNISQEEWQEEKALQESLQALKEKMGIIGYPFDNHEAELFALNRKIDYEELELQD